MTAVASQPTFPQLSRPAWGTLNGNGSMNSDESRGMFVPRKTLPRSNSASSIASTASTTTVGSNSAQSNGTSMSSTSDLSSWSGGAVPRNRPQQKGSWQVGKPELQTEYSRQPVGRPNGMAVPQSPMQAGVAQPQASPQGMMRPPSAEPLNPAQPVLYLLSLNGTFERKTISVPFAPDSLRIGRQTNQKTVPTPSNGFFDSKVLSRQHAEIFAERNGKVYIRDVKSSNGTFVNGTRLSQENRESEPHELSTGDHLELGIDIVSEDQKTVVHHKVAAKVEHSGFLNTSNNVMDMNFGDLDPANSAMMMPTGAAQMRGRVGSNASMGNNRMLPTGPANTSNPMQQQQQRPFFFTPIATDQILKRLTNEMRSAKLQSQDLNRTNAFINTLLSKDDVKDLDKNDGLEPPKPPPMINGNVLPFRADAKTRFSDPPAPPPQQPLPEKPAAGSMKRGAERPSPGATGASPIRQENTSQVKELIEALNIAKRDFDSQSVRMRELENMLQKEREARELAEDLARRLEENANVHMNGNAKSSEPASDETTLETPSAKADEPTPAVTEAPQPEDDSAAETATQLQTRIDHMEGQMKEMTESLREWQERCKVAEAERDDDRKTLAEMVIQLRAEEARRSATKEKSRSRSRKGRAEDLKSESIESTSPTNPNSIQHVPAKTQSDGAASEDETTQDATPAPSEAKTAVNLRRSGPSSEQHLQAGLPYASMVGVVLIGMGLMAYINGWQPQPARLDQ